MIGEAAPGLLDDQPGRRHVVDSETDGVDALARIEGEAGPRQLYWKWAKRLALRSGNWKLLRAGAKGAFQLFDLDSDPGERQNLAKSEPEQLNRMLELLRDEVRRDAVPLDF